MAGVTKYVTSQANVLLFVAVSFWKTAWARDDVSILARGVLDEFGKAAR